MKRYKEYLFGVVEDEKGKYIQFNDFKKVEEENKELQKTANELKSKIIMISAENENLNNKTKLLLISDVIIGLLLALTLAEALVIYSISGS